MRIVNCAIAVLIGYMIVAMPVVSDFAAFECPPIVEAEEVFDDYASYDGNTSHGVARAFPPSPRSLFVASSSDSSGISHSLPCSAVLRI